MNLIFRKQITFVKFLKSIRSFSAINQNEVNVTFVKVNGDKITAKGKIGQTLLEVVVANNLQLGGYGACEGTLICSTCHVIFKEEHFNSLLNQPTDEELDMINLAAGQTRTSRMGCQIVLTKEMDGIEVQVPATVNDQRK